MSEFPKFFIDLLQTLRLDRRVPSEAELQAFHFWVACQSKVETHVHLEAAVGEDFYLSRQPPREWSECVPWKRAPFQNLRGFIGAWVDLSRSLRELTDFEEMAYSFVAKRAEDRILYTEAYISPADFSFIRERFSIAPERFEFESVMKSYLRGLRRGLAKFADVQVRLTVDALWISSFEERETVRRAVENIQSSPEGTDLDGAPFIVAIGLGGMENHAQLESQKAFCERVRKLGLKIDIHSGEGGDPEIHLKTLEQLRPERVAHGFSAWTSHRKIADNVVMCPLSNILLNTYQGAAHEHPFFECIGQGLPVAVGSDDPLLLGTSLALEYTFIHAVTGNGQKIFETTQKNARSRILASDADGISKSLTL